MKVLYFDCQMGAAGDMLTASLFELIEDKETMLAKFNSLGLSGVQVQAHPAVKCGIHGTGISVMIHGAEEHDHHHAHHRHNHDHEHDGHSHEHSHDHTHDNHSEAHRHQAHSHTNLADIEAIIGALQIPQEVKDNACGIYQILAEAEAHAHGSTKEAVHFHEVGMLDAVADIVNVCLLLHELKPNKILVSPINTGSGHIHCAHGVLPVPAPAAAYILQGMPIYHNSIPSELCTPTGAAILKFFATPCSNMPVLKVAKIGYGMGRKEFVAANCVRSFLGETAETDDVVELSCNLDDMTPEEIAYVQEKLLSVGALDVYTITIGMKKSRSGLMLNCLCRPADKDIMLGEIFKHTTTLGVREANYNRHKMYRIEEIKETPWGQVKIKKATGYGVERSKAEYDDLKKIADKHGISLRKIQKTID